MGKLVILRRYKFSRISINQKSFNRTIFID